ncbi:DUF5681 domain-containing protein [Thiocapsa bogorovii]|uniref:DUF5681 domain-containing protein n=1 Tax=Thiocapsa bogorovii TaxID=521689 RepID=UPI001E4CFB10|nr:DUF5681 domain-containing protein [Thiocapsa bogorovii]UHD18575.1 DUF5681 domain-containing protein [Thiocapsa bogorovii]
MQFQKGKSGNPRGRPRRTDTEAALRQKIRDNLPGILDGVITQAQAGDTAAAKILLDRALPALKPLDRAVTLPLAGGLSEAGHSVLAAVGEGKLTPEQGARILGGIGSLARIVETDELIHRIEALEAATNAKPTD